MFKECLNLAEVVFPDNLKYIGSETFSECGLQQVKIPDSVKLIRENAFDHCRKLEEIYLGKKLKKFKNSFEGCHNLKKITVNNSDLKTKYKEDKKGLLQYMGVFGYLSVTEELSSAVEVVYL